MRSVRGRSRRQGGVRHKSGEGVKNSKKAARSLRTPTSGRPVTTPGAGKPAHGLPTLSAPLFVPALGQPPYYLFYRRLSAFIGGPNGVLIFRVGPEEKLIWPRMNADERR